MWVNFRIPDSQVHLHGQKLQVNLEIQNHAPIMWTKLFMISKEFNVRDLMGDIYLHTKSLVLVLMINKSSVTLDLNTYSHSISPIVIISLYVLLPAT